MSKESSQSKNLNPKKYNIYISNEFLFNINVPTKQLALTIQKKKGLHLSK